MGGSDLEVLTGGCHCGAVRFEVRLEPSPDPLDLIDCNCSICTKKGFLHLIVPQAQFRLLAGQDDLLEYRFNTGVARHIFCRSCGIHGFYHPRSHPDGVSVNARCLDADIKDRAKVRSFDGAHWEANIDKIRS